MDDRRNPEIHGSFSFIDRGAAFRYNIQELELHICCRSFSPDESFVTEEVQKSFGQGNFEESAAAGNRQRRAHMDIVFSAVMLFIHKPANEAFFGSGSIIFLIVFVIVEIIS